MLSAGDIWPYHCHHLLHAWPLLCPAPACCPCSSANSACLASRDLTSLPTAALHPAAGANAMALSLVRGRRVTLSKVDAFADGVAVKQVGQAAFTLFRRPSTKMGRALRRTLATKCFKLLSQPLLQA